MASRTQDTLPILRSVWKTGADFLDAFEPGASVLAHPSDHGEPPESATEGALLLVCIRFEDRDVEFDLHGEVVARSGDTLRISFLTDEQRSIELVLTSARGESLPYFRRRHPRIRQRLPVAVETASGQRGEAHTLTISEGGARVTLLSLDVDEDDQVTLNITFPADKTLSLRGRVTSVARQGPRPSFGVEFRFTSKETRNSLCEQVRQLSPEE